MPGSYLVISHASHEGRQRQDADAATNVASHNNISMTFRDRGGITRLFDGFELVEPGLVYTGQWRPDGDADEFDGRPERAGTFVAVGVKV